MCRPRRDQVGDEFSAEQLCAVRGLPGKTLQRANARSSLQRKIDRRCHGDDNRRSGWIFYSESEDRALPLTAGRYRTWLSQIRTTQPNSERRRSATIETGDGTDAGNRAHSKRTPSQNAQAKIDSLFAGGAYHRIAYG